MVGIASDKYCMGDKLRYYWILGSDSAMLQSLCNVKDLILNVRLSMYKSAHDWAFVFFSLFGRSLKAYND
jgi:hypothetical protein